jgi:hypothetical protein
VTDHHTLDLQSALWREVMYVIHNNVHHLSYIKLLLEQKGIRLPDAIGQEPATAICFRVLEAAKA